MACGGKVDSAFSETASGARWGFEENLADPTGRRWRGLGAFDNGLTSPLCPRAGFSAVPLL